MHLKTETKVGIFVLISIAIFAYMAMHLGIFNFHIKNYKTYYVYFETLSGLGKKADVKIAGVKVGWVDQTELMQSDSNPRVKIYVQSQYVLYSDAYAEIHQEGLLGSRYLEVVPGSPGLDIIHSGGTLQRTVKQRVSIEKLMDRFETIAHNIEDVSAALKGAIGTPEQQNELRSIVNNISEASKKIAIFADILSRNERNIDGILNDIKSFSHEIVPVGKDIHKIAEKLDTNIDRLSDRFDDTMKHIGSVAEKIDQGKGLIGKLINENDVYEDLKVCAKGIRKAADIGDKLGIVVDAHVEAMQRKAEHYKHEDSKGYFDFRFHTNEDTFYLFQIVGSEKGTVGRISNRNQFYDQFGKKLNDTDIEKVPADNFYFPPYRTDAVNITRNTTKYGFQFGKIYKDLALRFGIFENTVGAGVDYEIPFCNDIFRWVTTFEAFDLRGQDRVDDRSPHLKWINRIFLFNNVYFNFGMDDFVSKINASPFVGMGLRFSDDDLKYLFNQMGFITGKLSVEQ